MTSTPPVEERMYQLTLTEKEIVALSALFLLVNSETSILGKIALISIHKSYQSLNDKAARLAKVMLVEKRKERATHG